MKKTIGIAFMAFGFILWAYAQMNILPRSKRYDSKKTPIKRDSNILESLKRQNEKIKKLLLRNSNRLEFQDRTTDYNITMGSIVSARLLNSIISSNLSSPILVESINGRVVPKGTRFFCNGEEKKNRIHIVCKLVIIEGIEYPVIVQLLNLDGSAGLRGKIYTGDDKKIAGILSASILERMTDSLSKIAIKGRDEVASLIRKNSDESQKTIIHIESGTGVLVYFKKRFSP